MARTRGPCTTRWVNVRLWSGGYIYWPQATVVIIHCPPVSTQTHQHEGEFFTQFYLNVYVYIRLCSLLDFLESNLQYVYVLLKTINTSIYSLWYYQNVFVNVNLSIIKIELASQHINEVLGFDFSSLLIQDCV